MVKKIIRLFISKILGQGLKFLTIFYLSGYLLTAESFGMFSLYLVILSTVYLIVGLGIADTLMLMVNKNIENKKRLLGAALFLVIITMILYFILVYIILTLYGFDYAIQLSFLSSSYVIYIFLKKVAVPLEDYFVLNYYEPILYLLILIGVIFFATSVNSALFMYSICMFITTIIFLLRYEFDFVNIKLTIKNIVENIKSFGIKVHLSQMISMGTYDTDKFILEYIEGFKSVGVYNLALNFIMPTKLLSYTISEVLFKKFDSLYKLPKSVLIINSISSIIIGTTLSLVGYFLIVVYFDESYLAINEIIIFLPFLAFLSTFYVPINYFFTAKGMGKEKMLNAIVLGISNLVLNFSLVPSMGLKGAVIATIIALVVNNIMFLSQYFKKFGNNKNLTYRG